MIQTFQQISSGTQKRGSDSLWEEVYCLCDEDPVTGFKDARIYKLGLRNSGSQISSFLKSLGPQNSPYPKKSTLHFCLLKNDRLDNFRGSKTHQIWNESHKEVLRPFLP